MASGSPATTTMWLDFTEGRLAERAVGGRERRGYLARGFAVFFSDRFLPVAFSAVFAVFFTIVLRGFFGATVFLADFFLAAVLLAGFRANFFFGVFFLVAFLAFCVAERDFFFAFFPGVACAESAESAEWSAWMSMPNTSERSSAASRFDFPLLVFPFRFYMGRSEAFVPVIEIRPHGLPIYLRHDLFLST